MLVINNYSSFLPGLPVASCDKSDIVFVVDSSGSIYRVNWPLIINFMRQLVNDFQIGPDRTQVGVTLFGKS